MVSINGDITDGVDTGDGLGVTQIGLGTISNSVRVLDDSLDGIRAVRPSLSDTLELAQTQVPALGVLLRDEMQLQQVLGPVATFNMASSDALSLAAAIGASLGVSYPETAELTATLTAQLAFTLTETVAVQEALSGLGLYQLSQTEQVRLVDTLIRAVGAALADAVTIEDVAAVTGRLIQSIAETIETADLAVGSLIMQVIVDDAVEVTAEHAAQMLYNPTLVDAISLDAIYLSPGGGITTWALNTRTAALTEYKNYAFNSFASLEGRQLGATEDGIYELTGNDDAGTDIIAAIKTGMVQMGGSRFTSFKAAYLAVRGGGEYILKLEMGDGRIHHYTVTARDMETTKIRLGRGLKARYFSFELVSSGQDFDLDTLEFVPVVAQRRV